ncbi:MAG: hypothetical protein CMJ85_02300 [Planctomycetes bacterium]|jgi:hypothetical protein|nr:hypothetical protein [Planctomycetota bacterium]MDP6424946.1 PEP-CTERM sorting domain-containing protein [Planctomycetota bacterium]
MLAHVVLGIGVWLLASIPISTAQDDRSTIPVGQARPVSQVPEIRPDPEGTQAANARDQEEDPGPASPVPEPATLAIVGAGLLFVALLLRRRSRELGVESNA